MAQRPRYGGTRLAGRRYYLRKRPVVVVCGWGPGARVRNVRIRYLDSGGEDVRPFRGLTLEPRAPRRAGSSTRQPADVSRPGRLGTAR